MSNMEKVALVTGASSGIGQAIATKLSASGYRVFGASRRAVVADPGIQALTLDVTDDTSVTACVAEVLRQAGRIDLLVNSAGFALVAALEESTMAQVQAIFETNVFGVMRMTRAVLPAMRAQGAGRIVNISSIVGFLPAAYSGLYASTKHAVEGYSESLDHEVRTRGIRVCLIEPGFTMSNIARNMPEPDAPIDVYAAGRNNILDIFSAALAKGADPETVADAVLIAASAQVPKIRYAVGREAATLAKLRRFLPTAMFDRSLRSQFRLDVV
jgi:NAD(P)-dependent dehydrogenase (short-subunit alcohol dehydrogenase family)